MKHKRGEKMTFPAIFFKDGDGIGVKFPDLDGCFTCADDYENALKNAEEAMGGWVLSQEGMRAEIPKPTPLENVKTVHGEAIVMISADPHLHWPNKLGIEAKVNLPSLLSGAFASKMGSVS